MQSETLDTISDPTDEDIIEYFCGYEPEHVHTLPADWKFGGPTGLDPRVDPRWTPDTYVYFDAKLVPVHVTSVPFCDDEAIDRFTEVASYGTDYSPVWLQVTRRATRITETLPVTYKKETDEVFDKD